VALAAATEGPNRKLAQVTAAWAVHGAGYEVLLVMDSDVDPSTVDIPGILRATPTATPAMTWVPCAEARGTTLADRASEAVLAGSWHAFALLARIDGATAVGKISAISARAVSACGGLGAFTHVLGEDAALAQAILARGGSVTMLPQACISHVEGRSLAAVIARYSRWISVVRAQRPSRLAGYPALFLATPLLLGLSVATGGPAGATLAAATLATRWCVALAARCVSGRTHELSRSILDPFVADALLAVAFGWALTRRAVEWRGRRFRLRPGGVMVEVSRAPSC
jgi:ceramide glucosyltransferase